MKDVGPDPGAVASLTDLARELDLLRCRAARGTRRARVSLTDLAGRVDLPRSTVHTYVTGQTLAPSDVLDRIVIALGATAAEQARWSEAWFRVAEDVHEQRASTIHAARSVPRQLPMQISGFAGRTSELAELDRLVETASVPAVVISSIVGTAGIGKTALAVYWAHRQAERFPDGQLYINLRGFEADRSPIHPGEALGRFIRALGVDPSEIPSDVEECAGLFRSTVANRRMLILLDNAATVDQVRPLLPGTSPNLALVTSRNELTGLVAVDGAHHLSLDVLDHAEAMTLLDSVLGQRVVQETEAAAELASLCGYLPLALRVAAGKLVMKPWQQIADAAAEIRASGRLTALEVAADRQGADVRTSIALSYEALDPLLRKLFRRLGLVATPDWPAWVAQELLDEPASHLLDQLADAHLVEPLGHDVAGQPRYRMHDLIAEFAKERALADDEPAERDRSMERMLLGWLALASEADQRVSHGTDYAAGLVSPDPPAGTVDTVRAAPDDWFQAELPGLLAAVDEACRLDRADIGGPLALRLSGFLTLRSYNVERERVFRQTAAQFGDDAVALRLLGALYEAQAQLDMHHDLPDLAAKRLALARSLGDAYVEAEALWQAGRAARLLGRFDDAARWLKDAVEAARAQEKTGYLLASCLAGLGNLHIETGDAAGAVPLFEEGWEALGNLRTSREGALNRHRYAVALTDVGRLDDAERTLAEALRLTTGIGDNIGTAFMDLAHADVDIRRERFTEATNRIERSLEVADRYQVGFLQAEASRCLGDVAVAEGRHADAIAILRRNVDAWRDLDVPVYVARVLARLEQVCPRAGDHEAGIAYGRACRAVLTDLGLDADALVLPPYIK